MKNEDKKIQEPFSPDGTPRPPQVIDPSADKRKSNPANQEKGKEKQKNESGKTQKQGLLGDDTDISDETTI